MSDYVLGNTGRLIADTKDEPVAAAAVKPKAPVRRKRAHEKDGTFRADDPATPDHNEAWQAE